MERSWKPGELEARRQRKVEQGAGQRGLQPQEEEGQTSLKQGQLKAAERQKGTEAEWEKEQQ